MGNVARAQARLVAARRLARRRWWWSAAALVVVAGVLVWVLWPAPAPEPPRARQYLEFTACLLTDDQGVAGAAAAPVWAGMQDASLATRAKVQFLAVPGPQMVDNAAPFAASLVQRRCDLVFAVGPAPVAAVRAAAPGHPGVRFLVVTDDAASVASVEIVRSAGARAAVERIIAAAVSRS